MDHSEFLFKNCTLEPIYLKRNNNHLRPFSIPPIFIMGTPPAPSSQGPEQCLAHSGRSVTTWGTTWWKTRRMDITLLPTSGLISDTFLSSQTPRPVTAFSKCFFAFVSLTGLVVSETENLKMLGKRTTFYTLRITNPFNFCLLAPPPPHPRVEIPSSHNKLNRLNFSAFFQSFPHIIPIPPLK